MNNDTLKDMEIQETINKHAEKIFYELFPKEDLDRPIYVNYEILKEVKILEIKNAIKIQMSSIGTFIESNLYTKIACGYNSPKYYNTEDIEIYNLPKKLLA